MVHRYADDLFVLVHGKDSPSDKEWDAYIADLEAHSSRISCMKTLVFTKGGRPDGFQRDRLNKALGGRPTRAAVVTDSILARAVVTTLAYFNPAIRAFSSSDVGLALAYLELPAERYATVLKILAELREIMDRGSREGDGAASAR